MFDRPQHVHASPSWSDLFIWKPSFLLMPGVLSICLLVVVMGLIPLLLIGLVVWAVLESSRRRDDHPGGAHYPLAAPAPLSGPTPPAPSTARALIDERYAKGEIG